MRVGLPSGLLSLYYLVFWRQFFEDLGLDVVIPDKTTKRVLDKGVRHAVPEICVPIKAYTGHVVELLEGGVELVYVPRFVSVGRGEFCCPKFMGLPDMLRHTVPHLGDALLTHKLRAASDDIATPGNYLGLGLVFTRDRGKIMAALRHARERWHAFRALSLTQGYNCRAANELILVGRQRHLPRQPLPLRIGVLGYVYNVHDSLISMDILDRLADLGAEAVTFEMLPPREIERELAHFRKKLFWTFSNKLLAGAYRFFNDPGIDGVIHVTAFGCGPDSFLGKFLELDTGRFNKPFITIRVDEHTGENHLQTRIEAFVDMLLKQKREGGCASCN